MTAFPPDVLVRRPSDPVLAPARLSHFCSHHPHTRTSRPLPATTIHDSYSCICSRPLSLVTLRTDVACWEVATSARRRRATPPRQIGRLRGNRAPTQQGLPSDLTSTPTTPSTLPGHLFETSTLLSVLLVTITSTCPSSSRSLTLALLDAGSQTATAPTTPAGSAPPTNSSVQHTLPFPPCVLLPSARSSEPIRPLTISRPSLSSRHVRGREAARVSRRGVRPSSGRPGAVASGRLDARRPSSSVVQRSQERHLPLPAEVPGEQDGQAPGRRVCARQGPCRAFTTSQLVQGSIARDARSSTR